MFDEPVTAKIAIEVAEVPQIHFEFSADRLRPVH
jgi:hypothetical protein